ncbi:hypothetical protein PSPO01_03466 [Paraphaeosphaeria sporulosa]
MEQQLKPTTLLGSRSACVCTSVLPRGAFQPWEGRFLCPRQYQLPVGRTSLKPLRAWWSSERRWPPHHQKHRYSARLPRLHDLYRPLELNGSRSISPTNHLVQRVRHSSQGHCLAPHERELSGTAVGRKGRGGSGRGGTRRITHSKDDYWATAILSPRHHCSERICEKDPRPRIIFHPAGHVSVCKTVHNECRGNLATFTTNTTQGVRDFIATTVVIALPEQLFLPYSLSLMLPCIRFMFTIVAGPRPSASTPMIAAQTFALPRLGSLCTTSRHFGIRSSHTHARQMHCNRFKDAFRAPCCQCAIGPDSSLSLRSNRIALEDHLVVVLGVAFHFISSLSETAHLPASPTSSPTACFVSPSPCCPTFYRCRDEVVPISPLILARGASIQTSLPPSLSHTQEPRVGRCLFSPRLPVATRHCQRTTLSGVCTFAVEANYSLPHDAGMSTHNRMLPTLCVGYTLTITTHSYPSYAMLTCHGLNASSCSLSGTALGCVVFLVDMHTLSTLRLSGVLPGAFRRFMIPFEASPSVTTLSIDSLGAINSTALEHEQFNTSTASLERVMTSPIGLHEHANGDIRQCGPPPRTVWYCCNCGDGPHNIKLDTGCSSCGQTRCGSCTTGSAK